MLLICLFMYIVLTPPALDRVFMLCLIKVVTVVAHILEKIIFPLITIEYRVSSGVSCMAFIIPYYFEVNSLHTQSDERFYCENQTLHFIWCIFFPCSDDFVFFVLHPAQLVDHTYWFVAVDGSHIPEANPTWSWWIKLLLCYWICFARFCWRLCIYVLQGHWLVILFSCSVLCLALELK